MFERYTEKARRVIFFARYEASQFGSPYIETEHLLLGLLREDKALANRFLRSHAAVESIRKQIEGHTTIREKVSTSVDLPLSHASGNLLADSGVPFDLLSNGFYGSMGPQEPVRQRFVLAQQAEEQVFGFDIGTAELAGFIARKKYNSPSLLRVSFEHKA